MDTTIPPVWPEEGVDMSVVEEKKTVCPFCTTHTAYLVKPHTPTTRGYFMHCMVCNADGPITDNARVAEIWWNAVVALVIDDTKMTSVLIELITLALKDVPGERLIDKVKWLMEPNDKIELDNAT